MEFERKTLLQALGENKDEASKAALISRLRNGEIEAEGRLIYPEAMEEGQIALAQFQEIPREHWDLNNVDFTNSKITSNFNWTEAGNSDQQNWIEISVLLTKTEAVKIMDQPVSENSHPPSIKYRTHLAHDAIREVFRSLLPLHGVDMPADVVLKELQKQYIKKELPFIMDWEKHKGHDRKREVFIWKSGSGKIKGMRFDNFENIISKERDKYRNQADQT